MTPTAIRSVLDSIVNDPKLLPKDGRTFCNIGVQLAAEHFGYVKKLEGKLANEIIDFLLTSKEWRKVDGKAANASANAGGFAIAGWRGDPHGHVATVSPGGMVYSGKWGKDCPIVANIGAKNGYMGANFAFGAEPGYWVCQVIA